MTKLWRWFGNNLIRIYAVLGFTYLFIPIAYTFAFSFNDAGKSNLVWKGFTLGNWQNPCGAPDVCTALGNSIQVGLIATILATILGTLIAFALGRHSFKGRSSTNLLIFLPMATPEVVNFMSKFGRGLICTPISEELCDRLKLDMMVSEKMWQNTYEVNTNLCCSARLI